jgi:hypothetical protein
LEAVRALKMVDFPTFGKPTIPQFRGMIGDDSFSYLLEHERAESLR